MPRIEDAPPHAVVATAVRAAQLSPCAKSKRGVAIYYRNAGAHIIGQGFNERLDAPCDGACRDVCGKVCVHAETRAIRIASTVSGGYYLEGYDAVHVKVDARGILVPSQRPKCHQCSVQALDAKLDGFWLYLETGWRRYETALFHRLSLIANDLIPDARLPCRRCSHQGIDCVCYEGPLT